LLLGGPNALSPVVVDGLSSLGINPIRIASVDRFDTAMLIADASATGQGDAVLGPVVPRRAVTQAAAAQQAVPAAHERLDGPPAVASTSSTIRARITCAIGGRQHRLRRRDAIVGADRFDTAVRRRASSARVVGARARDVPGQVVGRR
jgi:hypothetical protein